MSTPFELEHWKSRAEVAERERDSARSVLASLRHYFHRLETGVRSGPEPTIGKARARLREHDREWWTKDHAMNAVAETLAGLHDEEDATREGGT